MHGIIYARIGYAWPPQDDAHKSLNIYIHIYMYICVHTRRVVQHTMAMYYVSANDDSLEDVAFHLVCLWFA